MLKLLYILEVIRTAQQTARQMLRNCTDRLANKNNLDMREDVQKIANFLFNCHTFFYPYRGKKLVISLA